MVAASLLGVADGVVLEEAEVVPELAVLLPLGEVELAEAPPELGELEEPEGGGLPPLDPPPEEETPLPEKGLPVLFRQEVEGPATTLIGELNCFWPVLSVTSNVN